MRHVLIVAGVAALMAFAATGYASAQNDPVPPIDPTETASPTDPAAVATLAPVASDEVVAACTTAANRDDCLAKTGQFVTQVKASTGTIDQQRQDLNTLVASLQSNAQALDCPSDARTLAADAITQVGSSAADIVEADAVNAIAESLRTCAPDTPTAAINPPASAG